MVMSKDLIMHLELEINTILELEICGFCNLFSSFSRNSRPRNIITVCHICLLVSTHCNKS